MFHLILFVLGLSFSVCSSTPKCLEKRSFRFLDCSGLMLNDTVQLPAVRDSWVERLDLRMNRFVSINFTKLILAYPNLRTVDVRDNVAFDCQMSRGLRIFIRSNCKSVSSIISAKTPPIVPPTSIRTTYGMPVSSTTSTTPSLLPPTSIRTTYGMPVSSTTSAMPSLLPPTSIRTTYGMPVSSTTLATPSLLSPTSIRTTYGMSVSSTTSATPSLLPPTSIRTTYGMPVSSTTSATPSLLPPTSIRTTYGMPVSSTVSIMRFSQFYTSSIQNRTTAFKHVGKSLELSFLLSVIIAPSLGLIIILVGLYIYTRRMIARRHRRINQHEQQTSQI